MGSPRFLFEALGGIKNLNFNYSYQNSLDKNIISSQSSNNKTHTIGVIHSLLFPASCSFTTSLLLNKINTSFVSTQIVSASENVGKRFFNNKLMVSLGTGINFIKTAVNDSQLFFNLNINYSLDKYGSIGFTLSNNNYRADSELTKTYSELYGSLQYNISF